MSESNIERILGEISATQQYILTELKDMKPRISWLETKVNYGLGIFAGIAIFSSYILQKLGLK